MGIDWIVFVIILVDFVILFYRGIVILVIEGVFYVYYYCGFIVVIILIFSFW